MKYRVKTTCYWGGQYYKAGEEGTIDESAKGPVHFQPVGAPKAKAEPKKEKAESAVSAAQKPRTRKGRGA